MASAPGGGLALGAELAATRPSQARKICAGGKRSLQHSEPTHYRGLLRAFIAHPKLEEAVPALPPARGL